jgi:hypothetical protein
MQVLVSQIAFIRLAKVSEKKHTLADALVHSCSDRSLQRIYNMWNQWKEKVCTCSVATVAKNSLYSLSVVLSLGATSEIPVTEVCSL